MNPELNVQQPDFLEEMRQNVIHNLQIVLQNLRTPDLFRQFLAAKDKQTAREDDRESKGNNKADQQSVKDDSGKGGNFKPKS
jgi:hypothetical protein